MKHPFLWSIFIANIVILLWGPKAALFALLGSAAVLSTLSLLWLWLLLRPDPP